MFGEPHIPMPPENPFPYGGVNSRQRGGLSATSLLD